MKLNMFSLDAVIFLLSSVVSLALVYLKVATNTLQQIIIVLLIATLILLYRFNSSKAKPLFLKWFRPLLLFLTSLMVQLIVISSGGFFSPFLILLHLFALGTSFLLNLRASVSFLVLSLVILIVNIWLNQNLLVMFKEDPFSIALYVISFLVIIPLAQVLNRSYFVKDTISRLLRENLYQGQLREKSILQGLNELVLVTDKDLKILSINQTAEKAMKISAGEAVGRPLLELLPLQYQGKEKANKENLSINQMLQDKSAHIMSGFTLTAISKAPVSVNIQARPITDSAGGVKQFVFVIGEGNLAGVYSSLHGDLEQAHSKFEAGFADFTKLLSANAAPTLGLQAHLLRKIEEDLLVSQELEDHSIAEVAVLLDVAEMCQQRLLVEQEFAKLLHVPLKLSFPPGEVAEMSRLSLKAQNVSNAVLSPISSFSVPIDPKWFGILMEKLLDISILLSSGVKNSEVQILLSTENGRVVNISMITTALELSPKQQTELLSQYYGSLAQVANLRLGSGLEGFIAQTIASHLNLPLLVKSEHNSPKLILELRLPKDRIKET